MPDNCKEYPGITRERINKFRAETEKSGQPLPPGDSFVIEKSGVKISLEYSEAAQTLKVCILEKPGFIPDSMVWTIIDDQMRRGAA